MTNPDLHRAGWPVIDIFGPTIQGEGPEAGRPCAFVRFGGCDYRCAWCDTMEAVEPAAVRANAIRMTATEIMADLMALETLPHWVVLSGGNPALHLLRALVEHLHDCGRLVAVETQGSVWRDWLGSVDRLVVSPKPPSSGMDTEAHRYQFGRFMRAARTNMPPGRMVLKIVVADEVDYEWARYVIEDWPEIAGYLSACTPQHDEAAWDADRLFYDEHVQLAVGKRYRWLCETVAADKRMHHVRVLPQLHVVAWGTRVSV